MALTTQQIQAAYVTFFSRPADKAGLNYWSNYSGSEADLYATFAQSQEYADAFNDKSNAQKVAVVYQNLFGRSPDLEGLNYWTLKLDQGEVTVAGLALTVAAGAQGADVAILENRVAAATEFTNSLDTAQEVLNYSGNAANAIAKEWLAKVTDSDASLQEAIKESVLNGVTAQMANAGQIGGNTFTLTAGADQVSGTSGNDTFYAHIFDNQNTLQSGDQIKGGSGQDTLKADIGNSQNFAITPELDSVERVEIRVQANQRDSGDNNVAGVGIIDAERSKGVNHWESNNSRGDLVIEDVRIAASQITKDVTIAFVESDPGHVDYAVYFDQHSLRSQTNTSSVLSLEVLDTRSAAAGTGPLKDSPYHGLAFNVTFPGQETPELITLTSQAIDDAQTYEDLAAAIQTAISANPKLAGFSVSLGQSFQVFDTLGSAQTGTTVLITTNTGATVSAEGAGTGWIANGAVPPSSGLHTNISNSISNSTDLVTSTIILDDVGRGSNGGDLIVGGLSVGDTSGSQGVGRFEIEVRDNSKLQVISSTNNSLKEVVLVNGQTSNNNSNAGSLSVLGEIDGGRDGVKDAALPGQTGTAGFTDVRLIDASQMTGNLSVNAAITEASIGKYLNLKDVQASPSGDNVAFQYAGGAGNDTFNVEVDASVLASRTLTGREDFTLNVNGGAGNDVINVDIGAKPGSAQWLVDQLALKNVSIEGGSGNDVIRAIGEGAFNIDAGTGDDTVYVDNTGNKAAWVVAAQNADVLNLQSAANALTKGFLYKGQVTVTFAAGAESGVTSALAEAFKNGFEARADVPTGENYAVTQFHINQAIKKAINESGVLSKLLQVEDGPGTSLVITSKIDGSVVAGDLNIAVTGANLAALNATEQSIVVDAFKKYSADSSATIATAQTAQDAAVTASNGVTGVGTTVLANNGSASSVENDSVVNAGAGNDVVVLSTGANSNSTVAFNGYDLGKTTVVNFSQDGTGADNLSFAGYLTSKSSASGSTVSQKPIAVTLNADTSVEANSVTKLDFIGAAGQTFAGLTAETLLAAINSGNTGASDFGNLTASTLDAVNTYTANQLVGGVGKAVVLVHNSENHGEYKAFELTFTGNSTNATADFASAQLISTIDLGEEVTNWEVALGLTAPTGGGTTPVTPPVGSQDLVVVADMPATPYDASTGAFNFQLDFATASAKAASITGFGEDDTISLINVPTGSAFSPMFGVNGANALDFAYANADFSNSWTLSLTGLDTALVTAATAGAAGGLADTVTAMGVLETQWGADWLVGAA